MTSYWRCRWRQDRWRGSTRPSADVCTEGLHGKSARCGASRRASRRPAERAQRRACCRCRCRCVTPRATRCRVVLTMTRGASSYAVVRGSVRWASPRWSASAIRTMVAAAGLSRRHRLAGSAVALSVARGSFIARQGPLSGRRAERSSSPRSKRTGERRDPTVDDHHQRHAQQLRHRPARSRSLPLQDHKPTRHPTASQNRDRPAPERNHPREVTTGTCQPCGQAHAVARAATFGWGTSRC